MRLAVVSPFLDRRHGTERCVIEQIERLARSRDWEIHLYAQRVEDLNVARFSSSPAFSTPPGKIIWHPVASIAGPHVLGFLWWYFANHFARWFDARFRSLRYDLVFTPGINCRDADAIAVHIVFHEFYRLMRQELRLRDIPLKSWARALHRKLYYRLIMWFEDRIYRNPSTQLAAVSRLTASELAAHFGRSDVAVIPNAIDQGKFNFAARCERRPSARRQFGFSDEHFVLLLVGNDWKKKGLTPLLQAMAACGELPLHLLVVGRDDRSPYVLQCRRLGLESRVRFCEPSLDVMQFYAAADVYTGPSLHDAFALPPAEAMACGLPVITSVFAGVSELIHEGVDGFVLSDSIEPLALAGLLKRLYRDKDLRHRVGLAAAENALAWTWDRNAEQVRAWLESVLAARKPSL